MIGMRGDEILHKIRIARIVMIAVRGPDRAAMRLLEDAELAHDMLHGLFVDGVSIAMEHLRDAPVAVARPRTGLFHDEPWPCVVGFVTRHIV